MKTSIGKTFLRLVKKHFPKEHRFSKIFNRYTLKLSYSCIPSMENVIKQHNNQLLLDEQPEANERTCNCTGGRVCPLDGNCFTSCIFYKATVNQTQNGLEHIYNGSTEGPAKMRINAHNNSFVHPEKRNDTERAKFIWSLKDNGKDYSISWSIIERACPYKCRTRKLTCASQRS